MVPMNEVIKSEQAVPLYGYADEYLEKISKLQKKESGFAPWVAWESENSSFGKTIRQWAIYPKFLPLYICSSHGVGLESVCYPNETESPYIFFTWNRKKNENMNNIHNKKSYHVPHPWLFYRKKYYPDLPAVRTGTLVFLAHSNSTTTPIFDDLEKQINNLKSLPEEYQPIVICLSFQDINKGFHKKIRKYDVPIVTAGTTSSQKFVDRFYSLISSFKYSTSSELGSFSFYLIEAGIPFFLYGVKAKYQITGSKVVDDGIYSQSDFGTEDDNVEKSLFEKMVSNPVSEVTSEQRQMVNEFLGADAKTIRIQASYILWREFLLHFGEFLTIYSKLIFNKFKAKVKSITSL